MYPIYIYRWCGGVHRRTRLEGRVGDSVNGILLGHPFTRTRRKLEDLIWRVVWIAFALAMPPIELSVIYVHIHTYYAHLYTDRCEYEHTRAPTYACTRMCTRCIRRSSLHENAVHSSFVRSFVVRRSRIACIVHRHAGPHRCIRYTRTYVCFRVCECARHVRVGSYIS